MPKGPSAFLTGAACLLIALTGCSDDALPGAPTYGNGHVPSTQGGAIILNQNERLAVVANHEHDVITVLYLRASFDNSGLIERSVELPLEPQSRPWAAVIGADDNTAFVILRGRSQVVRIKDLHTAPRIDGVVRVGAEPTSIAITPAGERVFVANWSEGTVSTFTTDDLFIGEKTDLNAVLAGTGRLGSLTDGTVWTNEELATIRPGLAHPRALALTDNGDDESSDETLYATEYFGQPIASDVALEPDLSREGIVYAINPSNGQVRPEATIVIPPLQTGFLDARGTMTSCFPNQLATITTDDERVLVTAMCASPSGPLGSTSDPAPANTANFKTLVHPVLHSIDRASGAGLPSESMVLTQRLDELYTEDGAVESRRMPLIPSDLTVTRADDVAPEGARRAFLTAYGADAVFSIEVGGNRNVGAPGARFTNLAASGGSLPVGVALSRRSKDPFALVLGSYSARTLVVQRNTRKVFAFSTVGPPLTPEREKSLEGRRLFATGLDAWSLGGQAWSSCESCHPEGLSDGVVWRFARGPRRSISTAGTYHGDDPTRRLLLWGANVDEVHDVEAIARDVSGGVGGVVWSAYSGTEHVDCRLLYAGTSVMAQGGSNCSGPKTTTSLLNGLNGSLMSTSPAGRPRCADGDLTCDISESADWDAIDAFIRTVRSPRAPGLCATEPAGTVAGCLHGPFVEAGEALFRTAKCGTCHAGPRFTLSRVFYTPGAEANGDILFARPATIDGVPDLDRARGALRVQTYDAGALAPLNPPGRAGPTTYRRWNTDGTSDSLLQALYSAGAADQINCILRDVGTFPPQLAGENRTGIVPPGAPPLTEIRMVKDPPTDPYREVLAFGETGFNVPTLVGMAAGAPFFHGGNARSLEELFAETFASHHANLGITPGFIPTPADVRDLVSYLLSLDEGDEPPEAPALDFEPDLCSTYGG